ncbi:MAG: ribosomal-processing cysteine protease Prp [Bacillota bacterium]|jgi:uncharacterized protein YsxB (DUF464 family)|nr:ribosomal-processing cysteine protease Prp [Candidatus Fermentithermobacillaceae bacterium]
MLKVQLLRKHDEPDLADPGRVPVGILVGFKVLGHAGFAEHGQDIVCAGVSALAQGALLGLQDVLGDKVSFRKQPGYLEVELDVKDAGELAPRTVLRTLELGLLSIARAYSTYIDVAYQDID